MNPIECNNVWKKFRKGEKFTSLRDLIPNLTKGIFSRRAALAKGADGLNSNEFWALKDVDFEVKKGEVLGIIGPNGAGKSTILKLLAKLMVPNTGNISIHGRLSALIEVTAGFHPEFTGKENIYFNGAILGMTKKEIDRKYDQIVEFSGVKDFIDTPLKRYSSGMGARLGFAVAAHVDPEVLLVDEVLSVGDMTFQSKCVDKMRELLNSGTTIIFISHNIPLIQSICERVILLNKGEILKQGYPEEVVPFYENIVFKGVEEHIKNYLAKPEEQLDIKGEAVAFINQVQISDENGKIPEIFYSGDPLKIKVDYEVLKEVGNLVFSYEIVRPDGILCCSSNTRDDGYPPIKAVKGKGSVDILLKGLALAPSAYFTKISIWDEKMIHPYIIKKEGIFTVKAKSMSRHINTIFIPKAEWRPRT